MRMFSHLLRTFASVVSDRRSRVAIAVLIVFLAAVPVAEMLVIRLFSQIVLDGPNTIESDPQRVYVGIAVFFVAFAITRALHHLLRIYRIKVFRTAFERTVIDRNPALEAWEWALVLELSNVLVSITQVLALAGLTFYLSLTIGLANALITSATLAIIAVIYQTQLRRQRSYLDIDDPEFSTAVSIKVGSRVRDAEYGAAIASIAMALVLAIVLLETLGGRFPTADAIVMLLAMRLQFSQVGNLSSGVMRFARAVARRDSIMARIQAKEEAAAFEDDESEFEDESADPSPHRLKLSAQLVTVSQRGDLDEANELIRRLELAGDIPQHEIDVITASRAFLDYMDGYAERDPVLAMWWAKPLPAYIESWLAPFIIKQCTGRPVQYYAPSRGSSEPHLLGLGSIGRFSQPNSVVVGTGVLAASNKLNPQASYHSLRGPLTAGALRSSGGPDVSSFGDPGALISRVLPLERPPSNGRLALVRHPGHLLLDVKLPDDIDELTPDARTTSEITELARNLQSYDGVVTSSIQVLNICHSYGLPCALVTFAGPRNDVLAGGFVSRDLMLGLGISAHHEATTIAANLVSKRLRDLLVTEAVSTEKLDEISAAVAGAVAGFDQR